MGLSLIGVVLYGNLVGSMLPFLLRRLGFDPAKASAPFVATLVDVSGLIIYFTVASLILRGVAAVETRPGGSGRAGHLPEQSLHDEPVAAAADDRGAVQPAEEARERRMRLCSQLVTVEDERPRVGREAMAPAQGEPPAGLGLDHPESRQRLSAPAGELGRPPARDHTARIHAIRVGPPAAALRVLRALPRPCRRARRPADCAHRRRGATPCASPV